MIEPSATLDVLETPRTAEGVRDRRDEMLLRRAAVGRQLRFIEAQLAVLQDVCPHEGMRGTSIMGATGVTCTDCGYAR